jgi:hypothetical protein
MFVELIYMLRGMALCDSVDYRPLNMQTKRDSFPMPLIDDVLFRMGSNQWFSALDVQSSFW